MVDYAATDRRSVAAGLRGRGDGRAERFLAFEAHLMRARPTMTLSEIATAYHDAYARSVLRDAMREAQQDDNMWSRLRRWFNRK